MYTIGPTRVLTTVPRSNTNINRNGDTKLDGRYTRNTAQKNKGETTKYKHKKCIQVGYPGKTNNCRDNSTQPL